MLVLLPHLLGSIVNISYNSLRIVEQLTEPQQQAFARLVLLYNLAIYPVCLVVMVAVVTLRRTSNVAALIKNLVGWNYRGIRSHLDAEGKRI